MQRCFPDPTDEIDDDALAAAYAWPAEVAHRAVVRANMVASLDAGVTVDGLSAGLGSDGDQRVFGVLRDLADVLLVGAGTIRAEGYGGIRLDADRLARRQRWGLGRPPPVAVVTSGGLDRDLGIFTDQQSPPIVVTTTAGARRMADYPATVIDAGADAVDLGSMLQTFAGMGLRRVLCEGGPGLLGRLMAAELLDELCLTTTPLVLGSGPQTLVGEVSLAEPARWTLGSLHLQGDHLFSCYRRSKA